MQRMWQDDRSHYTFNLETKEALKNICCDDSFFNARIKKKTIRFTLLIFMADSRTPQ